MNKNLILSLIAISFFSLMIFIIIGDQFGVTSCGCNKVISHNFLYLLVFFSTVFMASLVYYSSLLKIESKDKTLDRNVELLFKCLDPDEASMLKKIISYNGEVLQNDLNGNLGKIKAHRILKKLNAKKIINIIKKGRVNLISLDNELRKELIK